MIDLPDIIVDSSKLQYYCLYDYIPEEVNLMNNSTEAVENMVNICWQHQMHDTPDVRGMGDRRIMDWIDRIVFVSHYQKEMFQLYMKLPYSKSVVINNGIYPLNYVPRDKKKVNIVYASAPYKGIDIIAAAFPMLMYRRPEFQDIVTLDVYSSMKIYGYAYDDLKFSRVINDLKTLPNVTYHGIVTNRDLRTKLETSDILALPSIYEETSSQIIIEAMSAGCYPIASNIGSIPEIGSTLIKKYTPISTFRSEPERMVEHAEQYSYVLEQGIDEYLAGEVDIKEMVNYANKYYSWDKVRKDWLELFDLMTGE